MKKNNPSANRGKHSTGRKKSVSSRRALLAEWKKNVRDKGDDTMLYWEELNGIYENAKLNFIPFQRLIAKAKEGDLIKYLKPKEAIVFKVLCDTLRRDTLLYIDELNKIHSIHKKRRGRLSPEDNLIVWEINVLYMNWGTMIQSTSELCYDHLVDYLGQAATRRDEALGKKSVTRVVHENQDKKETNDE